MAPRPRWLTLVLVVAGVEMLLLVAQYLLGLWTNVYAPAMFTSSSSFPSLNWHYNIGFALFFVGIALVVLAALSRDWRLVVAGLVVLVAVYSAGMFGANFVSSSPNDPLDSFGMGAMFLVALFADSALLMIASRGRAAAAAPGTAAPASTGPA